MMYLDRFLDWCELHPTLTALVIVPFLTAVGNWLVAPKTLEGYNRFAARHPRIAAVMQIFRGAFGDPYKIVAWVKTLVTGRLPPAPPPEGPGGTGHQARTGEGQGAPPSPPAPPSPGGVVLATSTADEDTQPSRRIPEPGGGPWLRAPRAWWPGSAVVGAFLVWCIAFNASLPGCALFREGSTPAEKRAAVLSFQQVTCLLASGFFADSPEVRRACGIADALAPSVAQLFSSQRTGLARAAAARRLVVDDAGVGPYRDAYQ